MSTIPHDELLDCLLEVWMTYATPVKNGYWSRYSSTLEKVEKILRVADRIDANGNPTEKKAEEK